MASMISLPTPFEGRTTRLKTKFILLANSLLNIAQYLSQNCASVITEVAASSFCVEPQKKGPERKSGPARVREQKVLRSPEPARAPPSSTGHLHRSPHTKPLTARHSSFMKQTQEVIFLASLLVKEEIVPLTAASPKEGMEAAQELLQTWDPEYGAEAPAFRSHWPLRAGHTLPVKWWLL